MSASVKRSDTEVTVTCTLEGVRSSRDIEISVDELSLSIETPFHQIQLRLCAPVNPDPTSCQFRPSAHCLTLRLAVSQPATPDRVDPWSKVQDRMDEFERRVAALNGNADDSDDISELGQRLRVHDHKIEFVTAGELPTQTLKLEMIPRSEYREQENHGVGLGGTQWEAGAVLAVWLCNCPDISSSSNMLELGSGLGLCAIVAGLRGATVTATDYVPQVLRMCEQNIERHELCRRVRGASLLWGRSGGSAFLQQQAQQGDNVQYDVVMASDVVYNPEVHTVLLETLQAVLRSETLGVFVKQKRNSGDVEFFQLLREHGFVVELLKDIDTLGVPSIMAHLVRRAS
eukprot:TRINITY_DN27772_c0_g1_i1.p1 TRINITY_DN27772_c0_g1~~TRINITY_DN27772_c0_g1_i1.p1  ORF type:complete len:344 (+),score=67.30 TRINITY_DN27772_c0_g1_i1:95-1126(+)